MDRLGKSTCELQIRRAGFAPDQIRIRGVGESAGNRLLETGSGSVKALDRPLTRQERTIALIHIRGDEIGRLGVGSGQQQRRHTEHVRRQTRSDQL